MWADTRSVTEVEELKQTLDWRRVHQRTGCPAHTSFSPNAVSVVPLPRWVSTNGTPKKVDHCSMRFQT